MLYIRDGKVITPNRGNKPVVAAAVVAGMLAIGFAGVPGTPAEHVVKTVVQVRAER